MNFKSAADREYANGAFIAGAADYPPRWAAKAAAFRASLGPRAQLDLPYGAGERQRFDLFLPETEPKGVLAFIHGGYWMAFGPKDWSHLAAGALLRGWACALPGYTLAPHARITDMVAEMHAALAAIAAQVAGPVVATGHSAGGHLAARMGCADGPPQVARVVPISPLCDLAPLMATEMNETLRIDATEAAAQSPRLLPLRAGVSAHVFVGAQERPAFLWQARSLSEAWDCPWTVEPARHHFDVIDGLESAESSLTRVCLDGL